MRFTLALAFGFAACSTHPAAQDAASDAPAPLGDLAPSPSDTPSPRDIPALDAPDPPSLDVPSPLDVTSTSDALSPPDVPAVNPLTGRGMVETVRAGFMFTEGPQWRTVEADLLFSDIPANTIHQLRMGTFSIYRTPSDNSNGLAVDSMGRVLAAEHGSRSISRSRVGMPREVLASTFDEGGMRRRLNSPNDLVLRSDGTIYFTDPPYGINPATQQELTFNGVFRLTTAGALTAEWRGARASRPNGMVLSPDERRLYVADTADGMIRVWDVRADGSLANERPFAMTSGNPDGMAIDRAGNLFVTTRTGVQVFSSAAHIWGTIPVPEQPANCAFGMADARTLFITARTGIYRVALSNPGIY